MATKQKLTQKITHREHGLDSTYWLQAVRDAKLEIITAERRIAALREAIRVFRRKARMGDSFPRRAD